MGRLFEQRLKRMHQLVESMEGPMGVKQIDDIEQYVQENDFDWKPCYKFQKVQARPAKPGEEIETILKNGKVESVRTAKEGDIVVKNVDGPEQWAQDGATFSRKYVATDKPGIFKPKGGPMLAAEIQETISFHPPKWNPGEIQDVDAGGFLLMDPDDNGDIYAIDRERFFDTYKFGEA